MSTRCQHCERDIRPAVIDPDGDVELWEDVNGITVCKKRADGEQFLHHKPMPVPEPDRTRAQFSRTDWIPAEWWLALKDYLLADIHANREVAFSCQGPELEPTRNYHDGMVKAQQEALAKMRELEQS